MFVESSCAKTLYEKMCAEKVCMSIGAKFQTLCGRIFDTVEFLGVHVSVVSHATSEARAKGRMFFECGNPIKRSIRIMQPHVVSQDERDLQNDANPTNVDFSTFAYTSLHASIQAMQVHAHMQAPALKLFPDRKLFLLNPNPKIRNTDVAIVKSVDSDAVKLDVAETWMLHVYVPGKSKLSLLSFIKKIESMDLRTYASLMCGVYTSYSDLNKLIYSTENISGH
jgi:hypothetical protein